MSVSLSVQSRTRIIRHLCLWLMIFAALGVYAATKTWNGFSGNWTTSGAWTTPGGAAPGDTLIFPNAISTSGPTTNNDLPANSSFGPISVTGTSIGSTYTFTGNTILLNNSVTASTPLNQTWQIPLNVGTTGLSFQMSGTLGSIVALNANTLTLSPAAGDLNLNATITAAGGGIIVEDPLGTGSQVVMMTGNAAGVPFTVQNFGDLEMSPSIAGPVNVSSTGLLAGSGGTTGAVTVGAGGTLSPGTNGGAGLGTLITMGNLNMSSGALYAVATSSSGADSMSVTGSVSLGGADLQITPGFVPAGTSYTIISNDLADPVVGTFNGKPENVPFLAAPGMFGKVNYAAGDGNDVVFTITGFVRTWSGLGGGNNWNNPMNWNEGFVPASGDLLVYPPGPTSFISNNDIGSIDLQGINIVANGYTIGGVNVDIAPPGAVGIDTQSPASSSTLTLPLTALGTQIFRIGGSVGSIFLFSTSNLTIDATSNLAMNGVVSGTGGNAVTITSSGAAIVTASAVNTYSGGTTVLGAANLSLSGSLASGVTVGSGGATLSGTGTVSGPVTVSAGSINPGPTGGIGTFGTLNTGNLSLTANATFDLIAPPTPPSDQVNVTGTVGAGGTLTINTAGVLPIGSVYTIIANDGADPVSGTFSGLPQGALFSVGPNALKISYVGGTGNDITITRISSPTIGSITPSTGPNTGGTSVTITGTDFVAGATVTFAGSPATGITVVSPTTITATTPAGAPGLASVVVTNLDGGTAFSSFFYTCAPFTPTVTPSGPTSFCPGGSVTLTAPAGFSSYLWSPGSQTTQSILVTAAGSYSVTVTDASGCVGSSSPTTVTVFSAPAPTITPAGPTTFCSGGSVTLSAQSGFSTYLWSPGGQTTQSITATAAGNYTVTVTDTNGCTGTSAPQNVTVTPGPTVTITGPTSSCSGGTVTLTANTTGTVSYLWSPGGQTTQSITVPTSPGTTTVYTVTVTDSFGCIGTASQTISSGSSRVVQIVAPESVVAGAVATFTVQGTFSGPFTWSVLGGEIVSGQGTSSLQVRAGNGANITVFVTTPDGPCDAEGSATVRIVSCATAGPTLVAPAGGANVNSPVAFSWNAVAGAASYEVWVAQGTSAASMLGSTPATTLTLPLPSGPFTWYVIARLSAGCQNGSLRSETRAFSVIQGTNCPTAAPAPLAPTANSHVFSPVTFRWSSVTGASGYRVFIKSGGGTFEDLGILSATTTSVTAPLAPGDAVWYVEALYSGCPAVASQQISFFLDREDCSGHGAASLLAPPNNSTNASSAVMFRWTPVDGSDGYRVWVSINDSEARTIGETADTSFRATLEPGTVRWFVETLFEGCASTNSVTQTFTVPALANCNNQPPQLLSPADNSSTSSATVTFSWSNVGALEYELYLSVANGTPALITKTTSTSFTTEVPIGELDFFVRALFNGCPARSSASRHLTYQPPPNCSTERPIAISPMNETTPIPSPVKFRWSAAAGATQYRLTIAGSDGIQVITTSQTEATASVASGPGSWAVEALFGSNCPVTNSGTSEFFVVATPSGCVALAQPIIGAPSQISDNISYAVQWQPVVGATSYQLQRSATGAFDSTTPVDDLQAVFTDRNQGADAITIFYRVRAVSSRCTPTAFGPYSATVGVIILPAVQSSSTSEGSTLVTRPQIITYTIPLGAELAGNTFSATPTAPWITVTPGSGVVPVGGLSLLVRVDTNGLPVGTSAGNVVLSLTTPSLNRQSSNATTSKAVPVSVNKVTPLTPNPKSAPPPDALIIPAVAHAGGVNAQFESDVRITNTSAQVIKYQLTFTPSGDSGITEGRQANVDVEPGRTMALDDVLKSWFGTGTTSALGTLEIRPLTKTASATSSNAVKGLQNFATFASSRTFNLTSTGTFGQYIPAIPFANFISRSTDPSKPSVLSLQQIAQSSAFRTNLGFVEGSGQPANLLVSVFAKTGQKLSDFEVNLAGGQHLQVGSALAQRGLAVDDGRVEVRVTSSTGKVTAYASVLDNRTNDPLLVSPVALGDPGNTKFVLPGVAELSGGIPWRTDMRLFNPSTAPVVTTLTFQPLNATTPQTTQIMVLAGEVLQLDRVLNSQFGVTNDGGAIHITTPVAVNLIASARTFRPDGSGGSFGQFIQAVTPDQAVALGTRPLQILQVEESPQFRSNVGLAEVTGNPATVEVTAIPPSSKASVTIRVPMAANQVRQLNQLLLQMGLSDTHNARVTVRVVDGQGRVTAYASVIDAQTSDPTFVPAQ